ncbi:hypothetical protein [Aquimarina rhabdastrellae]
MSIYKKWTEEFKNGVIGYSSIAIIPQSCLGSIAAMFILMNGNNFAQMIQLFLVVVACMTFNAAVLSQQKPKMIFNLFIISIVTSIVLTIINLF